MLTETTVRALARLMSAAWGDGKQPPTLPANGDALARLAGIDPAEWSTQGRDVWMNLTTGGGEFPGRVYFPAQMEFWREGQDRSAKRRVAHNLASPEHLEVWKQIREQYPERAGGQGWADAERHFYRNIASGVEPQAMLDGTLRYRHYCYLEGKIGTELVKQASTFFGRGRWWEDSYQASRRGAVVAGQRHTRGEEQYARVQGLRDDV